MHATTATTPTQLWLFTVYLAVIWFSPLLVAIWRRSHPWRVLWACTVAVPFTFGLSWFRAWRLAVLRRPQVVYVVVDGDGEPWHGAPPHRLTTPVTAGADSVS